MKRKTDMKQKVLALVLTIAALAVGHTTAMAETVTYTLDGSTDTQDNLYTVLDVTASGDVTGSTFRSWYARAAKNIEVGLPGGITLSFGSDRTVLGLQMNNSGSLSITSNSSEGSYITLSHASKYVYHVMLKNSSGKTTHEAWNLTNSYTYNAKSMTIKEIVVEYATAIPMTNTAITGLSKVTPASSVDATLPGRTLYKDGDWNTLCLPFAINDFAGTPLEGATVKTLESASLNTTTGALTLNFSDNLTAIEAGTPYIIKWGSGENITNPVFSGVTIVNTAQNQTCDLGDGKSISFVGNYSPVALQANDNTKLYLGSNSNLYFPGADITINAFRAYFQMTGITAGTVTNARMNFGDNEATGIDNIGELDNLPFDKMSDVWYDLGGRKIVNPSNGQMPKGIYIHNGRKEVIK